MLEGLREECQLWGRELSRQGAGLARDRGRMEAQIEALTQDTASLREELQVRGCGQRVWSTEWVGVASSCHGNHSLCVL